MHRVAVFAVVALFLFSSDRLAVAQDARKTQPETALPKPEQFHLFLLVGQSNMAGRGKVSPGQKAHPRVLTLSKAGTWVPALDPLHFDKSVAGAGLGRPFAEVLAKQDPAITIGLIPCAAGGSPIAVWQPGKSWSQTKSKPYDAAMARARIALRDGVLKGILWHQGESDSKPELAQVYEQKLHELIARFRKELRAPEVPFLAGQLGRFAERPWDAARERVNQAHKQLPEHVEHTAFVSAAGLKHKGDKVHFDTNSLRILGERYAEAYLKMTGK